MKFCLCLCEKCLTTNKTIEKKNLTYKLCEKCNKIICLKCLKEKNYCKCIEEE